jgi:glycosyltransferase involved in cell wall biosynthesis
VKIALLHYTTWPQFGGVENVIRDQALMLTRHGHEVLVMSGTGENPEEGYAFELIPELSPEFPLYQAIKRVLDNGQSDQNFSKYRALLVEALAPYLSQVEVTFVHNIFTMHHNLPLTQALHDLSSRFRFVAWTHDLVAANSDYSVPNPTKQPWALMRQSAANVRYVTASEQRREELTSRLQPPVEASVIPNGLDLGRLFYLTMEMRESLEALALPARDFIFLLPARIMLRKNVEFAIDLMRELKSKGRNPLLLITGSSDVYSPAAGQYGQFLRQTVHDQLHQNVVFVCDHFIVTDEILHDLYSLSDCLLFPSKQEGFGLPVLEAAYFRLPVWCNGVPAFWATEGEGAFMINAPAQLNDAVAWLEAHPSYRLRRRVRQQFDMDVLYGRYYEPLLKSYA